MGRRSGCLARPHGCRFRGARSSRHPAGPVGRAVPDGESASAARRMRRGAAMGRALRAPPRRASVSSRTSRTSRAPRTSRTGWSTRSSGSPGCSGGPRPGRHPGISRARRTPGSSRTCGPCWSPRTRFHPRRHGPARLDPRGPVAAPGPCGQPPRTARPALPVLDAVSELGTEPVRCGQGAGSVRWFVERDRAECLVRPVSSCPGPRPPPCGARSGWGPGSGPCGRRGGRP